MTALPSPPSPWKISEPPDRDLADLFAAIDRHASVLLAKHPNLLIPGTGVGGYATMGPFTVRSLVTLWRENEWFAGSCPVCGGAARGVHATGLLTIGGIEGICLSCGMRLARFAGGICPHPGDHPGQAPAAGDTEEHQPGLGGCAARAGEDGGAALDLIPNLGIIVPNMGILTDPLNIGLADALFSQVQQRVLGLLFGQPERRFQGAELIQLAQGGTGAVHRQLTRLERVRLVTVTRIGNQKYYQANSSSAVYHELHGLIVKTVGMVGPLRQSLEPLAASITAAFVFGSVAKGT